MFARLYNACSACCTVLCREERIVPEERTIISTIRDITKAHFTCMDNGIILAVDSSLATSYSHLIGKNIFEYKTTLSNEKGAAAAAVSFYQFQFLPGYDFSCKSTLLDGKVFLLFQSIVNIEKPEDSLIHWLGNTASIARSAIDDPRENPKLFLHTSICCIKARLAAIRDQASSFALASASDINVVLSNLAHEWEAILGSITHRSNIKLTHQVKFSTELSTLTLLLQEAYLLLMSDIVDCGGAIQYTIGIEKDTKSEKLSLFIELKNTKSSSTVSPTAMGSKTELAMFLPSSQDAEEACAAKGLATSDIQTQFATPGEVNTLERLRIVYQAASSTFQFFFQDIAIHEGEAFPQLEEVKLTDRASSHAVSPARALLHKTSTPPIGFASFTSDHPISSGYVFDDTSSNPPLVKNPIMSEAPLQPPLVENILVVDDEASNRRLAERFIKKIEGYSATLCEDGQDAVTYFSKKGTSYHEVERAYKRSQGGESIDPAQFAETTLKAHIVLMDQQMRKLNGTEAAPIIHWLTGGRVHIIPMTANAHTRDLENYAKAGMIATKCIGKPFSLAAIKTAIDHVKSLSLQVE